MNYNRLSNFYGIYSIIQFVHTKFIKVVLTDYVKEKKKENKESICETLA